MQEENRISCASILQLTLVSDLMGIKWKTKESNFQDMCVYKHCHRIGQGIGLYLLPTKQKRIATQKREMESKDQWRDPGSY